MVDRVNLIMKAKNITARQFAEEIGIQPSGISHILSGRNKPSLDFVQKVIRRWPEINISWLMFGKGEMFVSDIPVSYPSSPSSLPSPFSQPVIPNPNGTDVHTPPKSNAQYELFSGPDGGGDLLVDNKANPIDNKEALKNMTVDNEQTHHTAGSRDASTGANILVGNKSDSNDVVLQPGAKETVVLPESNSKSHESTPQQSTSQADVVQPILKGKNIVKFIVFYDDHTYCEYHPNDKG